MCFKLGFVLLRDLLGFVHGMKENMKHKPIDAIRSCNMNHIQYMAKKKEHFLIGQNILTNNLLCFTVDLAHI